MEATQNTQTPGTPGYVEPVAYAVIVAAQMAAIEAWMQQNAAQGR